MYVSIANGILHQVNLETYVTPAFNKKDYLCAHQSLQKLDSITYFEDSNGRLLKITLMIQQHSLFKLDVWVNLSQIYRYYSFTVIQSSTDVENNYTPFPIIIDNKLWWAKIVMADRLDVYAGECEELTRRNSINPQLCTCHESSLRELNNLYNYFKKSSPDETEVKKEDEQAAEPSDFEKEEEN